MANADVLLTHLTNYRDTLRVQVANMRQQYAETTKRWNSFSLVYEGVAADQFRNYWLSTCRHFDEYITQTESILVLLDQKIEDLHNLTRTESI